ncbi:hypothetical protein QLQ85_17575 [Halomonas sp. M4R5S39]|uniref:hypothetical protein n=1 Tax=Halomonas kalidii TaxID=3043293 RepID=UPI0024A81926|nr:hypothetical protein [Halomonas kalidii]MDI5986608.1 hypothetical protein [Halomonas kalidii]
MALDAPANGRSPLEVPVFEAAANRLPPLDALMLDADANGRTPLEVSGLDAAVGRCKPLAFEPAWAEVDRRRVNPAGGPELHVVGPSNRMPDNAAGTFEPTGGDVDRRRVNPAGGPELHVVMSPCPMPNASVGMPRHVTPTVAIVVPHPMPRSDHDRPRRMPMHMRHPMAGVPVDGAEGELRRHQNPGTPQDVDMHPRARHRQGARRQRLGMERARVQYR